MPLYILKDFIQFRPMFSAFVYRYGDRQNIGSMAQFIICK